MNSAINCEIQVTDDRHVSQLLFGGLLLFFLFEYVRPGSYFPVLETLKINTLIPVAVFILTLMSGRGRPPKAVLTAPSSKWFLLFIAFFPLQVLTADVKLYVYEMFKAVVGYLLIYYVIIRHVTKIERIRAIFFILVLIHVLLIVLNPDLVLHPENRNYIMGVTFLGDGNDFAWSVCIIIPFALFLAQSSQAKLKKMFFTSVFVLLVLAVIATQSRGGSLALGASILYLVLRGNRKAIGLIGLGILIAIVSLFAPQAYFDRMNTLTDYENEGSAQGRILAWNSAIRMAVDHPFTGVGAGHFGVKFGVEYRPPGVGRTELPWLNAHSIYFLTLGEFGFSGIIFLLGLIITNMLRNERILAKTSGSMRPSADTSRKLIIAMQASFISFAVGGAFLSGLYYPHIFVVCALNESVCLLASKGLSEKLEVATNQIIVKKHALARQEATIRAKI
jgi:putative inorganic carbon (hco3(-)) transporter